MHEFGALEAESKFGELLDRVEAGEEVVIFRDGKAVARIVPSNTSSDPERARRAADAILAMSIGPPLSDAEHKDLVAEGRR